MPYEVDDETAIQQSLLSLAQILFCDRSVEETLEAVAALAQQAVGGCDSASVTVMRNGRPQTTASTSELAWDIDQHQYGADEGPCLDAVRLNRVIRVDSYAEEQRWPELTAAAQEHGAKSSLSLPLFTQDDPVGALNLYSRSEAGFDGADGVGEAFATQAAITLANATAYQRAVELANGLQIALERRDVIGQAR